MMVMFVFSCNLLTLRKCGGTKALEGNLVFHHNLIPRLPPTHTNIFS